MITPDDEHDSRGDPLKFIARWNILVSALIVEPSVKLVARTAADFAVADGERVFPGNERLARQTSYDPETIRFAWKVMRALGMAARTASSEWDGKRRLADEYDLKIPPSWDEMPVFGPSYARFRCQFCGRAFNPRPGTCIDKAGAVSWYLDRMVFCPKPGTPRSRPDGSRPPRPPSCLRQWGAVQVKAGQPTWGKLGGDPSWAMFRAARDDDW